MAVSSVIFSLFVVAYSDRMMAHDWMKMPEPWLLMDKHSYFDFK